ncbi:MAG: DUF952 domain-containing protein [Planctomycetota bacterium]
MPLILHITTRDAWDQAQASGRYEASSLATEGFIHLSTPTQVIEVAGRLFGGRTDLILLCVDSSRVEHEIRYENCEGGSTLFPHVYGPLNLDAVIDVVAFAPKIDGSFRLPENLPTLPDAS